MPAGTFPVCWAVLLWGAAAIFLYRRLEGCFVQPLSTLLLLAFASFLGGGTWLAGECLRNRWGQRACWRWEILCFGVPWGMLGWAVQVPGTPLAGVAGFWLLLLATWAARWVPCPVSQLSGEEAVREEPELEEAWDSDEEPLLPDDVTGQLTRSVSPTHGERVEGLLRAVFAPGQRKSTLLVAFCPPFSGVPQVTCEPVDGEATVESPLEIFPHGAKISVRKTSASPLEDRVLFHFLAVEK
ncbi:MAG: hypothetical protein Q4D98_12985 [Planctomycetia bacterium]|nr:hypothetical protein [Planctomycetia bacterium]